MKKIFLPVLCFLLASNGHSQTMQGTIAPGSTPRTLDIYLKSSASFSQKDEAMTFALAIPSNVSPAPTIPSTTGVTANDTGAVTALDGLQLNFLIDSLGSTQREVVVSTETINGTSYYIYTFIFAGTAPSNHDWIANEPQKIFSIQFNGCTSNCILLDELLVNLPNGGANGNAYWYFQPNTLGDITNYPAPFYENPESGTANNGGSIDGSALSTLGLLAPVVLPINLESLNAKADGCTTKMTWKVESETGASYYAIERRENTTGFNEVGRVNVLTQNNFSKPYSFSDNTATNGTFYYRLRMVSKDGIVTYSPVKEVNLNCAANGNVSIYPTLSKGLINVKLMAGYENSKIKIINSIGEEVAYDLTSNMFRQINLKGLANGNYFVQVINNNKITERVKIVLAR